MRSAADLAINIHLYREHLYRFIAEVGVCDCLDFIPFIRDVNSATEVVALRISLCDNQAVILPEHNSLIPVVITQAIRGQRKVADALGINESQISRWKDSFIPKMAMLLAVLEWGVEDEELAELAKKVAMVLTKEKPQDCCNSFEA